MTALASSMASGQPCVAAIDQGTTSTRCMLFDHRGRVVARHQQEHRQILPRAGWVEHDPKEIWQTTEAVIAAALQSNATAIPTPRGFGDASSVVGSWSAPNPTMPQLYPEPHHARADW